jgi:hypothetical protein
MLKYRVQIRRAVHGTEVIRRDERPSFCYIALRCAGHTRIVTRPPTKEVGKNAPAHFCVESTEARKAQFLLPR